MYMYFMLFTYKFTYFLADLLEEWGKCRVLSDSPGEPNVKGFPIKTLQITLIMERLALCLLLLMLSLSASNWPSDC